ncbi:MAG: hypothetical protein PHW60_10665 [Kiritimatiellae bacterium]|nr:hypothetical protein [Kiritimatiellia bacterium]
MNPSDNTRLIEQLDSFDLDERAQALKALAMGCRTILPEPLPRVNMHLHSFFSYNTKGYSPSRIAWEARRQGLFAAGLCDFDVLDGLEEFLAAGQTLGLRATVNLETRAFCRDYAQVDINSPGEPGVAYIMGAGFARSPTPGSRAAATLLQYRRQAGERNRSLVARINVRLPEIALDYDADVLPLSPGACPTERHIICAYREKAKAAFKKPVALFAFWAKMMKAGPSDVETWSKNISVMEDKIRAVLAKSGGIGYERPTEKTFPPVDEFAAWVRECQAMPMAAWLDGTTRGEADSKAMMECLRERGVCALNIIPDRNHRIADPAMRAVKLQKLAEIMDLAEKWQFPVNIGTEMNKDGQPFVDDTGSEALRPYHAAFMRGARIMVGQTLLARYANFAYVSAAAQSEFGNNARQKNDFFEAVGLLPPLTTVFADKLESLGPDKSSACLRESARRCSWMI